MHTFLLLTSLFLFGGGNRPPQAVEAFVQASGGEKAHLLIFPWASQSTNGGNTFLQEVQAYHPEQAEVVPMDFSPEARQTLLAKLQTATGIFFTGGDQNKLMDAIRALGLKPIFQELYHRNIVFGGTSAGTAVMAETMLTGLGTGTGEGLGLLPPSFLVDQHFLKRLRLGRLMEVALREHKNGIGVDEDNAVLISRKPNGIICARAIGPTHATFVPKIETLREGDPEKCF